MADINKIKAVLFDKDGTLIDFADTFFDACKSIIVNLAENDEKLALQLANAVEFDMQTNTCSANSEIVGGTTKTIAALWAPLLGRNSIEDLSRDMDVQFDEYTIHAVRKFDFTLTTLEDLAGNEIPLGVATNDSQMNAHNHLGKMQMEHFFGFVAGYDSGFGSKPEPGMVQEFARHAGYECGEIAMVGDSFNDLMAAKNAGAIAIAVTSGLADEAALRPYADIVLKDISHIPQLLKI